MCSIMNKKEVAQQIFDNMDMTKEQYIQFCILADELGLEIVDPNQEESEWK